MIERLYSGILLIDKFPRFFTSLIHCCSSIVHSDPSALVSGGLLTERGLGNEILFTKLLCPSNVVEADKVRETHRGHRSSPVLYVLFLSRVFCRATSSNSSSFVFVAKHRSVVEVHNRSREERRAISLFRSPWSCEVLLSCTVLSLPSKETDDMSACLHAAFVGHLPTLRQSTLKGEEARRQRSE